MRFGEIVAPSIKELFIQKLEEMILSGELKPGDKLPTERELADEMKISKTVVHEGIRELSRLGFLDVASRKGVTVADQDLPSLAYALFRFHRTLVFLSGNSVTPLIMNGFMPSGLPFWEEYIRRSGVDFCIRRLELFLECIRDGDGKKAADVLRQGLIDFDCDAQIQ